MLTLYLAEQLIEHCISPVTTVTRLSVLSNQPVTDVVDLRSTQEEADTRFILYGIEIHKDGTNIHIYASDPDVFILALAMMVQLGDEATVINHGNRSQSLTPYIPCSWSMLCLRIERFPCIKLTQLSVYLARARMLGEIYLQKPAQSLVLVMNLMLRSSVDVKNSSVSSSA